MCNGFETSKKQNKIIHLFFVSDFFLHTVLRFIHLAASKGIEKLRADKNNNWRVDR